MSLAHGHLVVCTTTQCLIYRTTNWHSPVTFDLKPGTVTLVAQAAKHFLLANALGDIFVCLDSEARFLRHPRFSHINQHPPPCPCPCSTSSQVHSYEGRTVCTPKVPNLRSELVNKHTVALSDDTICIRDPRCGPAWQTCFCCVVHPPLPNHLWKNNHCTETKRPSWCLTCSLESR